MFIFASIFNKLGMLMLGLWDRILRTLKEKKTKVSFFLCISYSALFIYVSLVLGWFLLNRQKYLPIVNLFIFSYYIFNKPLIFKDTYIAKERM